MTREKKGQAAALKRVLHDVRPYWAYLALSLLTAAFSVATQLYVPILTGDAIDEMIGQGAVNLAGVAVICRNILLTIGVTALSQWILGVCNNRVVFCVTRDLRDSAMDKLQSLPIGTLDAHSAGWWPMWISLPTACSWASPSCSPVCLPFWVP